MKDRKDQVIQGRIAGALKDALKKQHMDPDEAARLLNVELGTMYKYLAGDMIPGGQVLWLACFHLDMVLDKTGLRAHRQRRRPESKQVDDIAQYELPFINESVMGKKIRARVRREDSQYVSVSLRIKVAG